MLSNECSFPSVSDGCKIGTKSRARTTKWQKKSSKGKFTWFSHLHCEMPSYNKRRELSGKCQENCATFPTISFLGKRPKLGKMDFFSIAAFLCQYVCVCGSPSHAERRRERRRDLGGMRRRKRGRRGNG